MTPKQCRAARMAVGLSAAALAEAAGLKQMAVERFELGEQVPVGVHRRLQQVLETAGIEFIADNCGSSGGNAVDTITAGSNPPIDEDAT